MNLRDYDMVIINTSGGKDSLAATWEVCRMAEEQGYPKSQIFLSHQILEEEWPGTLDLIHQHTMLFGVEYVTSARKTRTGEHETLLQYVERRGKWPARGQRYCTSDFKRGPGARVVTSLDQHWLYGQGTHHKNVLYVFGFRRDESPVRSKFQPWSINTRLTTKKRIVVQYLPVFDWTTEQVWDVIHSNNLPYHYAYDMGMPRLSCCFCIFSPFDALVVAGKANPELLDKYVEVEKKIGHTFRHNFPIASVKKAIEEGYQPKQIQNWVM